MSEWAAVPLSEIAQVVDCEHKTAPAASPGEEYGYSIGTPHLRGGRIDYGTAKRVSEETFHAWSRRAVLGEGDMILAREAPVGQVGLVDPSRPTCLGQRTVLVRPDRARVVDRFLHGYLLGREAQAWMSDRSSGSTVAHLNVADVREIPVALPPIDEQRRIAAALCALDDLIETDRTTAEAALELATASFSQLAAGSSATVKLSDVTTKIGSGATPRGGKDVYQEAGVAFIRSQNVYDGKFTFDGLARISDPAADALRAVAVLSGDVLVNITGESVTRTALVPDRALPARVSQHVAIVRPDAEMLDARFLMLALLSSPTKAHLNGLSTAGATRRALTKTHLAETRIPLPPLAEQRRVAQVLDTIEQLRDEIADVTQAFEALLPLLMSGSVRVSANLAGA